MPQDEAINIKQKRRATDYSPAPGGHRISNSFIGILTPNGGGPPLGTAPCNVGEYAKKNCRHRIPQLGGVLTIQPPTAGSSLHQSKSTHPTKQQHKVPTQKRSKSQKTHPRQKPGKARECTVRVSQLSPDQEIESLRSN